MARRVSLPPADSLFRRTEEEKQAQREQAEATGGVGKPSRSTRPAVRAVPDPEPEPEVELLRRPSGRVKHDEKMTVYVTSEELLELEHARLSLRSRHGLVVDRGRLVREALALVLADLELHGETSALVLRLNEE
jgi:hypothetical protein